MFFGVSYSLPSYSLPSYSLPLFLYLTSSLPQPVKLPGWKVHTYKLPNSIFDGQIANRLSILCILTEVFSHAHAKGGGGKEWGGALMVSSLPFLSVVFGVTARQAWQWKEKYAGKRKEQITHSKLCLQVSDLVSNLVRKHSCLPKLSSRV